MYRIGKEEMEAAARVIGSTDLFRINTAAREVDHFEEELAQKTGTQHALCVTSGTAALICALAALEIGPGDEVIVPGYTFMATATAVLAVGAIPVIAEVDSSLTIDPADIEKKITPYTKAIIPVHLNGLPCDMDRIMEIAKKHDLRVLEDACQADGGSYKGKRLGSIGEMGAFSFNYYKIITAGEGGAVITNSKNLYQRALVYHDGGSEFRPFAQGLEFPIFLGSQFRSNEISGAMLREQLKKLDTILNDLRRVKKTVMEGIADRVPFIRSNDIEGDCGTHIGLLFDNDETARRFTANCKSNEYNRLLPIDSNKHVFSNWTPILEKRFGHTPTMNPFLMPRNQGRHSYYAKDMCPDTLALLKRSVLISVNPDWSETQIERYIADIRQAAKSL